MSLRIPPWQRRENEERQLRSRRRWLIVEDILIFLAIAVLVLIIGMFVGLTCMNVAHASPLDCEGIRNADQRHFCRALSKPQKSECEFIKDPDLRHQCRARVK